MVRTETQVEPSNKPPFCWTSLITKYDGDGIAGFELMNASFWPREGQRETVREGEKEVSLQRRAKRASSPETCLAIGQRAAGNGQRTLDFWAAVLHVIGKINEVLLKRMPELKTNPKKLRTERREPQYQNKGQNHKQLKSVPMTEQRIGPVAGAGGRLAAREVGATLSKGNMWSWNRTVCIARDRPYPALGLVDSLSSQFEWLWIHVAIVWSILFELHAWLIDSKRGFTPKDIAYKSN